VFTPAYKPYIEFQSGEEINNWLLENAEVRAYIARSARPGENVLVCLGIHGQMIYANLDTGLVGAKRSSWPEPQHAAKLFTALRAFDTLSRLHA
jgi:hypothetical protein